MDKRLWQGEEYEAPDPDALQEGCWIEGWWGQYATDRVIVIARGFGMRAVDSRDALLMDLADARLEAMGGGDESEVDRIMDVLLVNCAHTVEPSPGGTAWRVWTPSHDAFVEFADRADADDYRDEVSRRQDWQALEELVGLADDAEAFLNDVVAARDHSFVWIDGEFFYEANDRDDDDYCARFDENVCGGAFDGFAVYSDADPGL